MGDESEYGASVTVEEKVVGSIFMRFLFLNICGRTTMEQERLQVSHLEASLGGGARHESERTGHTIKNAERMEMRGRWGSQRATVDGDRGSMGSDRKRYWKVVVFC